MGVREFFQFWNPKVKKKNKEYMGDQRLGRKYPKLRLLSADLFNYFLTGSSFTDTLCNQNTKNDSHLHSWENM